MCLFNSDLALLDYNNVIKAGYVDFYYHNHGKREVRIIWLIKSPT